MPNFNVIHRPALSCFEKGRRISFGQFDESWLKFSPVCVFSWSSCLLCTFVRFCVLLCASSNFPPIFLKTTRSQVNQFYSFIQIKSSPESKWNVVTILLKKANRINFHFFFRANDCNFHHKKNSIYPEKKSLVRCLPFPFTYFIEIMDKNNEKAFKNETKNNQDTLPPGEQISVLPDKSNMCVGANFETLQQFSPNNPLSITFVSPWLNIANCLVIWISFEYHRLYLKMLSFFFSCCFLTQLFVYISFFFIRFKIKITRYFLLLFSLFSWGLFWYWCRTWEKFPHFPDFFWERLLTALDNNS